MKWIISNFQMLSLVAGVSFVMVSGAYLIGFMKGSSYQKDKQQTAISKIQRENLNEVIALLHKLRVNRDKFVAARDNGIVCPLVNQSINSLYE